MDLLREIEALIRAAKDAPIMDLAVEKAGWRITISRQPGGAVPVAPPVLRDAPPILENWVAEKIIVSSGYGVFHASATPDDPAYAALGQTIAEGQQVGIVEAMKVFSAIFSPFAGQIVEILVTSGADVEAGQPLFRLA